MPAPRTVLAEFFTTGEETLLFLVREDYPEPTVVRIPTPVKELRDFVTRHFAVAAGRTTGERVSGLNETDFQTFLEPFLKPLVSPSPGGGPVASEGDLVWLVPHDVLHYLPLHAVKVEGRYLVERNPVCYTPSASVMKYCRAKRKGRHDRALVLADTRADRPLPHARLEAAALEELFRPRAEVYLGEEATPALLKKRLAEAAEEIDVLHLACHGFFDPAQALQSGIELAPEAANGTDPPDRDRGHLTAAAIFGLRLHADLITLSACESGVNERRPGDELIGLTRALIYAGTPSVVVSLWSVSDISTSILMGRFYQAWKGGAGKAEALRQAQTGVLSLTARDVLAHCEEAKRRVSGPGADALRRLLLEDVADVQFRARDYAAARSTYAQLLEGLDPGAENSQALKVRLSQCTRAAARFPGRADYEARVFADLYHWAPFILVGDWK
jgi:CHAT domain-containing protein